MAHLTEEQLEEALAGAAEGAEHLKRCPACRSRLAAHRAVQLRLRAAFAHVRAPAGLADRIHQQLTASPAEMRPRTRRAPRVLRLWPALAAAAALLVGVPLLLHYLSPSSAAAAARLVQIHEDNVVEAGGFHREADPQRVAAWLGEQTGRAPAAPHPCRQCGAVDGCSVATFRGESVGTYRFDTPEGKVSIVIVVEPPEALALAPAGKRHGRDVWSGRHGGCEVAAVRIGERTYCAVGRLGFGELAGVLGWAVPELPGVPSEPCPFCGRRPGR